MSNLFNLKKWLTVPDAASYLSLLFKEPVSEADMLRFALDGHVTLSVNFVNGTFARKGALVPKEEVQWITLPSIDGSTSIDVPNGIPLDDESMIVLPEKVERISGVWDLAMVGAEALDVEHEFQRLTEGPRVTGTNLEGPFVRDVDGVWCQLQERREEARSDSSRFYPAAGLPRDSVFVFRTSELTRFHTELSKEHDADRKASSELGRRSEGTYLRIIGGLLDLLLGTTVAGKPQSVFANQASIINALTVRHPGTPGISKATLEAKFSAARRQLISDRHPN
jgi:hypothetical protein